MIPCIKAEGRGFSVGKYEIHNQFDSLILYISFRNCRLGSSANAESWYRKRMVIITPSWDAEHLLVVLSPAGSTEEAGTEIDSSS